MVTFQFSLQLSFSSLLVSILLRSPLAAATAQKVALPNQDWDRRPYIPAKLGDYMWYHGSATFYDLTSHSSGACGYPNASLATQHYYAATPFPRFGNPLTKNVASAWGMGCGQCYQVRCINVPRYLNLVWCNNLNPITVTITDVDAPFPGSMWPNNHFDLEPRAFKELADPVAGGINVMWRRVPCAPSRRPKWSLSSLSNGYFQDVVVWDAPGAGTIVEVAVKLPGKKNWLQLQHKWGAHWWLFKYVTLDSRVQMGVKYGENTGRAIATYTQLPDW